EGRLLIAGTKGYIVAEAPWWKTTYFEVHFEDADRVEKYSERFLGDGLRYEISALLKQINGNTKTDFKLTRSESITMAGIMEQFMIKEGRCTDEDMGA
ncbi:MAG: glycerol-3-phosphate cytidylyltransferase, partial [Firmicutes bacterium]|nr:glycerol-3-phosphate cytidylyltransferase [Bacillota bacterium]